jgi:hypothetical protein
VAAKAMAKIDAVLTSIHAKASSGGSISASLFGGSGSKTAGSVKQQLQLEQLRGGNSSGTGDAFPPVCCLLSPGITMETELPAQLIGENLNKTLTDLQGGVACTGTAADRHYFKPGTPSYAAELQALLGSLQQSRLQLQTLQQQQQQHQSAQHTPRHEKYSYLSSHTTSKQPTGPEKGIPRHAEERAQKRAAMYQAMHMATTGGSSSSRSSSSWQQHLREYTHTTGGSGSSSPSRTPLSARRHSATAARASAVPTFGPGSGSLARPISSNNSSLWTVPGAAGPEFQAPSGSSLGRGLSQKQIQYVMTRTGYGGLYYSLS